VGDADNVLSVTSSKQALSQATLGASHKYLANLIPTCEIQHGSGYIPASKNLSFNPKASSKSKMFFDGLALREWQMVHGADKKIAIRSADALHDIARSPFSCAQETRARSCMENTKARVRKS
jgi:hypothetical protein